MAKLGHLSPDRGGIIEPVGANPGPDERSASPDWGGIMKLGGANTAYDRTVRAKSVPVPNGAAPQSPEVRAPDLSQEFWRPSSAPRHAKTRPTFSDNLVAHSRTHL
jgi:hypothetical protein